MQPDDFRVQVGLYERMGDLLRRLGDVPPGTRVQLQVPPRALALRTLDDARLLRERQHQQQIDLIIASTDASILAQARSYGFPVEDLRVQRRGGGPGTGPGLAQGMFRGLGQPGQAPAADPPSRPAPVTPPRDPGLYERPLDPFRGLETAGRTPDFYVEPPAGPLPPALPPFRAPEPTPPAPRAVPVDAGRAAPLSPDPSHEPLPTVPPDPFRGLEAAGHALDYRSVPAPPPSLPPADYSAPVAATPIPPPAEYAFAPDPGSATAPAQEAAPPVANPVEMPTPQAAPPVANPAAPASAPDAPALQSPPSAIAPPAESLAAPQPAAPAAPASGPPGARPARRRPAPSAPPVMPPAAALPAASASPALETPRLAPPDPRETNGAGRAVAPVQPPIMAPAPPVVTRPAAVLPAVPEAPAPVPLAPRAPAPESPPARPRFGLGALRDAIATRLSRDSNPAAAPDYTATAAPAASPVVPPAPPIPAGRTPVRLPPDFAIEVSRQAASAPRGVEFSTALEREEPVEDLLERLEQVKAGTTIRLHVPREALALQTLEEYDMLEALQERRQVRLAVVSSNATVIGMAWLYGFEVSDLRSPRPAGALAASLQDEYIVDMGRQEGTADLLRRLDGIPTEAKIEIHVPREGAALRTPEDYQIFRAARDWQPGQVRITSRDPRVIDLARIYDFDGEYTLEIGPQETTAYALKWLSALPPGAGCRLRVHRDTTALRRPADYKLLRSRQGAGQLQLTLVSRDLRVLGLATVHGLAVDNLRLRRRIPVGASPAARPPAEIAPALSAQDAPPEPVVPFAQPMADAAPPASPAPAPAPDEARICAYLEDHDSITRAQCERLLGVSRTQAKMRLQKMREQGILRLEGTGNNIRYALAAERRRRAR